MYKKGKEFFMYKRYAFCSLGLISFLTLLLASGFELTSTNFSVIGSRGGRRLIFLLWGALTGNYFYLYTEKLIEMTDCQDRIMEGFLLSSLFFFITAVGIPYIPEQVPRMSRLHVEISFLAPLLLGISQLRFLLLLQNKIGNNFLSQWFFMVFLGVGSTALFLAIGIVSSLLEIFLILGICLYLLLLHYKLKKLTRFI